MGGGTAADPSDPSSTSNLLKLTRSAELSNKVTVEVVEGVPDDVLLLMDKSINSSKSLSPPEWPWPWGRLDTLEKTLPLPVALSVMEEVTLSTERMLMLKQTQMKSRSMRPSLSLSVDSAVSDLTQGWTDASNTATGSLWRVWAFLLVCSCLFFLILL